MKPILFNTEMVRATQAGDKTVTRRLIRPQFPTYQDREPGRFSKIEPYGRASFIATHEEKPSMRTIINPPYLPGDILYVREKFAYDGFDGHEDIYVYWADVDDCDRVVWGDLEESEWAPSSDYHWHPSIHMPKEAARLFLRVTGVRVERLQEITFEQALKEGITRDAIEARISPGSSAPHWVFHEVAKRCFAALWDSTVKPEKRGTYGWAANPWVWVIEFERCEKPKEGNV